MIIRIDKKRMHWIKLKKILETYAGHLFESVSRICLIDVTNCISEFLTNCIDFHINHLKKKNLCFVILIEIEIKLINSSPKR